MGMKIGSSGPIGGEPSSPGKSSGPQKPVKPKLVTIGGLARSVKNWFTNKTAPSAKSTEITITRADEAAARTDGAARSTSRELPKDPPTLRGSVTLNTADSSPPGALAAIKATAAAPDSSVTSASVTSPPRTTEPQNKTNIENAEAVTKELCATEQTYRRKLEFTMTLVTLAKTPEFKKVIIKGAPSKKIAEDCLTDLAKLEKALPVLIALSDKVADNFKKAKIALAEAETNPDKLKEAVDLINTAVALFDEPANQAAFKVALDTQKSVEDAKLTTSMKSDTSLVASYNKALLERLYPGKGEDPRSPKALSPEEREEYSQFKVMDPATAFICQVQRAAGGYELVINEIKKVGCKDASEKQKALFNSIDGSAAARLAATFNSLKVAAEPKLSDQLASMTKMVSDLKPGDIIERVQDSTGQIHVEVVKLSLLGKIKAGLSQPEKPSVAENKTAKAALDHILFAVKRAKTPEDIAAAREMLTVLSKSPWAKKALGDKQIGDVLKPADFFKFLPKAALNYTLFKVQGAESSADISAAREWLTALQSSSWAKEALGDKQIGDVLKFAFETLAKADLENLRGMVKDAADYQKIMENLEKQDPLAVEQEATEATSEVDTPPVTSTGQNVFNDFVDRLGLPLVHSRMVASLKQTQEKAAPEHIQEALTGHLTRLEAIGLVLNETIPTEEQNKLQSELEDIAYAIVDLNDETDKFIEAARVDPNDEIGELVEAASKISAFRSALSSNDEAAVWKILAEPKLTQEVRLLFVTNYTDSIHNFKIGDKLIEGKKTAEAKLFSWLADKFKNGTPLEKIRVLELAEVWAKDKNNAGEKITDPDSFALLFSLLIDATLDDSEQVLQKATDVMLLLEKLESKA